MFDAFREKVAVARQTLSRRLDSWTLESRIHGAANIAISGRGSLKDSNSTADEIARQRGLEPADIRRRVFVIISDEAENFRLRTPRTVI